MLPILLAAITLSPQAQPPAEPADRRLAQILPVGVRYQPATDPVRRRADLETIRQLRFNVIAARDAAGAMAITPIEELLRGDARPLPLASREIGVIAVTPGAHLAEAAWWQIARGARAVIFEDWTGLQRDDRALADAATFADAITRNPELYVPLRPADKTGMRGLTIEGQKTSVEAQWLESPEALLLIAVNRAAEPRDVTFLFSPEMPEAIWQNMLTGAAVNFVAGPKGPVYARTFPPHDVLVLMIRKRLR
jgi:hypothetical protein